MLEVMTHLFLRCKGDMHEASWLKIFKAPLGEICSSVNQLFSCVQQAGLISSSAQTNLAVTASPYFAPNYRDRSPTSATLSFGSAFMAFSKDRGAISVTNSRVLCVEALCLQNPRLASQETVALPLN